MAWKRHRFLPFGSLGSLESLGPRLSPSGLSLGVVAEVSTMTGFQPLCDSGDDPPITQPDLPPTGPAGPGSSS